MRIHRSAWHFRMYRLLISLWSEGIYVFEGRRTSHEPRDLCHYFWTIVAMVLSLVLYFPIAVIVGIVLAILFAVAWTYETFFEEGHNRRKAAKKAKRSAWAAAQSEKPKQPGLIKSYVQARKQKVCPMIELVD